MNNNDFVCLMTVPPRITDVTQTQYSIQQGRNIVLPCRAEGRPQPQIAWEKDGEELTGSYHYRLLRSGWLLIPYSRSESVVFYPSHHPLCQLNHPSCQSNNQTTPLVNQSTPRVNQTTPHVNQIIKPSLMSIKQSNHPSCQ